MDKKRHITLESFGKKKRIIIAIAIGILIGGLIEVGYNVDGFRSKQSVIHMTKGNEVVEIGEQGGKVVYDFGDFQYVDKFSYKYSYDEPAGGGFFNTKVSVTYEDIYGNQETIEIADDNPHMLTQSVVAIHKKVKNITLLVPEGYKGARIFDVNLLCGVDFNVRRWLFWATMISLIASLFLLRETYFRKIENVFLVIGLVAGTLMVLLMPLCRVGLDEETHFKRAYEIKLSSKVSSSTAIDSLITNPYDYYPYNVSQSVDELELIDDYFRTEGDYGENSENHTVRETKITSVGAYNYIFMALGIKIGKVLHLPFAMVFVIGRLCNMWSYIALVYLAIRKTPIGKTIMAGMALMPTPMLLASAYSYDPVITGFVFVGMAYLIDELIAQDRKLEINVGFVILFALGFGLLPKGVYFPLMFLPFLISKSKFNNERQRHIFRMANTICVLGLMFSIILPMLVKSGGIEDARVDGVDAMAQIKLILAQPLSYLLVWFKNIGDTFWSYCFAEGTYTNMGHLGGTGCTTAVTMFLLFVIVTDRCKNEKGDLKTKQKISFGVAVFFSIAFVWGALYLGYNRVAATTILGVQGRYYIPLLFPLYLIIRPRGIMNQMESKTYNLIFSYWVLYIVYTMMYEVLLLPHCF